MEGGCTDTARRPAAIAVFRPRGAIVKSESIVDHGDRGAWRLVRA